MERINVRVEGRVKLELEAEAARRGVRPSEIVRRALGEHLSRQATRLNCYELAQQLGIVGLAKGLPADLSTNPGHMEGFGSE